MAFKDKLKKYRDAADLTQRELADKLDVKEITVSKWEQGTREPKITALTDIAKVLKCKPQDLL